MGKKVSSDEILNGKWLQDASLNWSIHTVPTGSNQTIVLDGYDSVWGLEAVTADVYVKEVSTSGAVASTSLDGYGMLVRLGSSPTVISRQFNVSANSYLAARSAEGYAAKLRKVRLQ